MIQRRNDNHPRPIARRDDTRGGAIDRSSDAPAAPMSDVEHAKAALLDVAERPREHIDLPDPLRFVRDHPYLCAAAAFVGGWAVVTSPRARRIALNALSIAARSTLGVRGTPHATHRD